MPVTSVMGGFGRVLLGANGAPTIVGGIGPLALTITAPGLERSEAEPASNIGPLALTITVGGLERSGPEGLALDAVALTIEVPGVTRS